MLREALLDGKPVLIGGVGGVKTHADARGKGYAADVVSHASRLWSDRMVEFGLLVCERTLLDYYGRLGWNEFEWTLLTIQNGKSKPFDFNRVMLLPIRSQAPVTGVIDLKGPPW